VFTGLTQTKETRMAKERFDPEKELRKAGEKVKKEQKKDSVKETTDAKTHDSN
jgi:hypothetical protein